MPVLYLAGSERGAGKTSFATAMARYRTQRGRHTPLFKPVRVAAPATQVQKEDPDSLFYSKVTPQNPLGHFWPLTLTLGEVTEKGALEARLGSQLPLPVQAGDLVLAEGLDGLDPSDLAAQLSRELAQVLDASVVAVVRFQPGMSAQSAAHAQELFGDRLVGIVLNGVTCHQKHYLRTQFIAQLQTLGLRLLAAVPEDRRMLSPTVRQIAEHLGAEFLLLEENGDELVEHFMVGGWFLDEGRYVFSRRERKAVLVRGDRPDLQMAALESDCICLILTAGQNPVQYIVHHAGQKGVPLLLTSSGTVETMEKLHTLKDQITAHHLGKVQRFAELLSAHNVPESLDTALDLVSQDT